MLRWFCALVCFLACSGAAFANPVTLRARVEASGPAITLGDVFDGAGDVGARAIAPAPAPGQVSTLSVALLSAASSAAGLEWTPPIGVNDIRVVRPGGMRATLAPASGARAFADAAIRRGETVTLVFQAPGVTLSTRVRALEDAGIGQNIRLMNTTSNRTIDATVTGPGAARAEAP
jgi:hypothetical protein